MKIRVIKTIFLQLVLFFTLAGQYNMVPASGNLKQNFVNPPQSSKPWVYWFWLDGNITREGIMADLEAMNRAGVGGVLIMEVDQGIPKGPVRFGSLRWRKMFSFMVKEAAKYNIEVDMNNDAGWCGSGGPWNTPEHAMQKIVWTETRIKGPARFNGRLAEGKKVAGFLRDIAVLAFPTPSGETGGGKPFRINNIQGKGDFSRAGITAQAHYSIVPAKDIVKLDSVTDITKKMDKNGLLKWDVPPGKWTVLRISHTPTGKDNHPAPLEGRGLECDKLSSEAMDAHFAGLMKKLISDVGPAAGRTLTYTHIDSWEVHSQNWTPKLREEFSKRRGYDMLPYLPVLTGRVEKSLEISERFLWDLRKTISELLVENYAGRLAELAHKHGMLLSIEAYGDGPFDDLSYAGRADSPMAEFWVGGGAIGTIKSMASAGHTYGKNIIGAESFTASTGVGKWMNHPYSLKALGDTAFCEGINRFVVHRYALQPWLDRKPGMTMGPWGVHYERTNTWWNQSLPWHQYLARCQYMLRQGLFIADICYLQSEGAPNGLGFAPRSAYDFDGCTPEVVLKRMTVRDGRLVLPDGMSYRLLVLPPRDTMTPELLSKISDLVKAGATVIGQPPLKSPSLSGYPDCDKKVQRLAAKLWGNCDGKTITEHKFGKGKIVWGKTTGDLLKEMGVGPDLSSPFLFGSYGLHYIHRATKDTDIYFVATSSGQPVDTSCTFRVKGKRPEFWHPDTGVIEPAPVYCEVPTGTRVAIRFDPCGSVFVVFRGSSRTSNSEKAIVSTINNSIVELKRNGKVVTSVKSGGANQGMFPDNNSSIVNTFTMSAWVKPAVNTPLYKESNSGVTGLNDNRNDVIYPPPGHEVYKTGQAGAGFSVGKNGVCVIEHSDNYFAPVLSWAAQIKGLTHVAIVYRDGQPSLYLNGRFVHKGLKSTHPVHSGVGVRHGRPLKRFRGQILELRQFKKALTPVEIADLAKKKPVETKKIIPAPPARLLRRTSGKLTLQAFENGNYKIKRASGKSRRIHVSGIPAPLNIQGPWLLNFPPKQGAPDHVTLNNLVSWSEHKNKGVKYFSGTATYTKDLQVPSSMISRDTIVYLDLGSVKVIAQVALNGKDLGILWKPPFQVDITGAVRAGVNKLSIRITNLWPNRMIGDENLPEDSQRYKAGNLIKWPKWLLQGKPSPTGRYTFTTWRHWSKNSPLFESGLLGPVTIRAARLITVK